MKEITLPNGKKVRVDDDDYENLMRFKWHEYNGYAATTIMMHDVIMSNKNEKMVVDHKNFDGLDNQKANLRKVTKSQNMFNRGKQKNNTSGYKVKECTGIKNYARGLQL